MPADRWRLVPSAAPVADPPPAAPDPRLNAKQRLRRAAYRYAIDAARGRAGVRVVRLPGRHIVLAETVDALRHSRKLPDRPTARLTVLIGWWRAPWRGWTGRVAPIAGLRRVRATTPLRFRGPSTVDLTVSPPRPARELAGAVAPALRPVASATTRVGPREPGRILVDAALINPRGRRLDSYRTDAPWLTLRPGGGLGRIINPWRYGSNPTLSWPTVAALRGVGGVSCPDPSAVDPALLVQLAMTGVIVHSRLDANRGVGPELRDIMAEPVPGGLLAREERSVRQRRAALRAHGLAGPPPSVSVILATRRAEHVAGIIAAMAAQTYPDLELVVCLHGIDIPPAIQSQLDTSGRPYQLITAPADLSFGAVLGLATARAQGRLLAKVDDDDTYGREHLWDLVLAHHYSGATMVGKGAEFVYLEDAGITVRRWSGRPEWGDNVVAGGTMLIRRGDLVDVGGWRPVPRAVDRALLDRLLRAGGTVYRTHPLGYLYHRRSQGHTWDPGQDYFMRDIRARWEGLALPDPG